MLYCIRLIVWFFFSYMIKLFQLIAKPVPYIVFEKNVTS